MRLFIPAAEVELQQSIRMLFRHWIQRSTSYSRLCYLLGLSSLLTNASFQDAVLYHLPEPNVPDLVGDMVPESMLGGGLWAEQLLRHQAEARLRPFMGDAVDRAILRRAIDPVMEYLRAELLPAIFNGNYEGSSWDVAIHPSLHYRIYK